MSNTLKWILGILAALIIVGVVAAAVFVWWNHSPLTLRSSQALPQANGTTVPNMPYGFDYNRRYHMDGWGFRGPMMHGGGFARLGGFGVLGIAIFFLGGLLRLIIPIGVLALVAVIFYQMGKRAGSQTTVPPPGPDKTPLPGRKVARS